MSEHIKYIHNVLSESTLNDFFTKNRVFWGRKNVFVKDILLYKVGSEKNIEKIYSKYDLEEKKIYEALFLSIVNGDKKEERFFNKSDVLSLPIKIGTEINIPKSNFDSEIVSVVGKNLFLEQGDFNFLWSEKLFKMVNDPEYVRLNNLNLLDFNFNISFINQNCQVWVWIRSQDKIINISPFIISLSTSKHDIGTFSININPIRSIKTLDIDGNNFVDYFNLIDEKSNSVIDFFHQYIQMNDVVFIRFEKLKLEERRGIEDEFEMEISKERLPGKVWDMIGLIDRNSITSNLSDTSYEVNLIGRDLSKVFIEDASYYLPIQYLSGEESRINLGFDREDRWYKRNINGGFGSTETTPSLYSFIVGDRSISDTVGFIINQLSNLGVVGDSDLFSYYKDRRVKAYRISGEEDSNIDTKLVDGIWQIIKVFYDSVLEKRRVIDGSLNYVDGSIIQHFNKICQKPFVELFSDTYGDEYNIIIRQPPFTKGAIRSFLQGVEYHPYMDGIESKVINDDKFIKIYDVITINLEDIQGYNSLQWDTDYFTSYQIVPKNELLGQYQNLMVGGIIPIVYLEEFAKIFGNRRYSEVDNYLSLPQMGVVSEDDNSYTRSLINDLKYVIDIHSYLPFTRKGSITLVGGDRRIKKGIFIRIKPTNEVFYVDSVSHSLSFGNKSVDRSTTIQVSRGMIENYIFGDYGYDNEGRIIEKDGVKTKFCYFDIVKTFISKKKTKKTIKNENILNNSSSFNSYSVKIKNINSPALRNNNPGNLIYVGQSSAQKGEFRYFDPETKLPVYWCRFNTPELGFQEVIRQLNIYSTRDGFNIEQAINRYAPSNENNTQSYINFVCNELNTNKLTKLSQVDLFKLAKAIVKLESSTEVITNSRSKISNTNTEDSVKEIQFQEHSLSFIFDKDQFDFFLKRMQMNIQKFTER